VTCPRPSHQLLDPTLLDSRLVKLLEHSQRLLVFTGAGISTASGIPDYRGPQGVWKRRQPVYYQDFMASEAARVEYWSFKLENWATLREARPNSVHAAVVRLERAGRLVGVVTQNVDGLHYAAGTSREKLIELHGTDREIECQTCRWRSHAAPLYQEFATTRKPPRCDRCGGFLKPATISFGQELRPEDLGRAKEAASAADLVLALGSTLSVTPAADIPLLAAADGARYAIVNRGETAHDGHPRVTLRLEGDVLTLFPPAVDAALANRAGSS
jgi:NAD-dependent deacetylase